MLWRILSVTALHEEASQLCHHVLGMEHRASKALPHVIVVHIANQ